MRGRGAGTWLQEFEGRIAADLGKESALFVPTGLLYHRRHESGPWNQAVAAAQACALS